MTTVQEQASAGVAMPAVFRVWIRPMGHAWKIRTEGVAGASWLVYELSRRNLECTDPAPAGTDMFVLRCMSATVHEKNYVWNLLKRFECVDLQNDPA